MTKPKKENISMKLIKAVQERPILHSKQHPDSSNRSKKNIAWKEVLEEMGLSDDKVLKKKWKNLKDTYRRLKLTEATEGPQKPTKWSHLMTFLDPSIFLDKSPNCAEKSPNYLEMSPSYLEPTVILGRPNRSTRQTVDVYYEQDYDNGVEQISLESFEEAEEKHIITTPPPVQNTRENIITDIPQDVIRELKRQASIDIEEKVIEYTKVRRTDRPEEEKIQIPCDSTDVIFLGYAATFKTLSCQNQAQLKYDIAKIILETELKDIHERTHNRDRLFN